MNDEELLRNTIERLWESIPPVWGKVRGNVRANAVEDLNVTLVQFHILRHIRQGAHSVGELAEMQQISRPAVSQAVELLVEKGLVFRKQESRDRRFIFLDLTETGNYMLNAIYNKNRLWMAEKMVSLSSEDLNAIIRAMAILKKAFVTSEI